MSNAHLIAWVATAANFLMIAINVITLRRLRRMTKSIEEVLAELNKLIGVTLLSISSVLIGYLTGQGYGNVYAGWVLNFACGTLAGCLWARR